MLGGKHFYGNPGLLGLEKRIANMKSSYGVAFIPPLTLVDATVGRGGNRDGMAPSSLRMRYHFGFDGSIKGTLVQILRLRFKIEFRKVLCDHEK